MVKEQRDERHMFVLVAQTYTNTEITNPELLMLRKHLFALCTEPVINVIVVHRVYDGTGLSLWPDRSGGIVRQ